eukprot:scaffold274555_cov18-Tisochrysis_lutea.AAC.2
MCSARLCPSSRYAAGPREARAAASHITAVLARALMLTSTSTAAASQVCVKQVNRVAPVRASLPAACCAGDTGAAAVGGGAACCACCAGAGAVVGAATAGGAGGGAAAVAASIGAGSRTHTLHLLLDHHVAEAQGLQSTAAAQGCQAGAGDLKGWPQVKALQVRHLLGAKHGVNM